MTNFYSNFDPLVANGILPAPIESILNGSFPLNAMKIPFCPNATTLTKDIYTSSAAQKQYKKTGWKGYAFAALMTVLAFAGLKKLGFNPIGKIINSKPLTAVKDFLKKLFNRKP